MCSIRAPWQLAGILALGLVTGCPLKTFELEDPQPSGGVGGFGGQSAGSAGTPSAGGTEVSFGGFGGEPAAPTLEPDHYAILQGETLRVLASNGVLANDSPAGLSVVEWAHGSVADGFEAFVDIDLDGGFTFKPVRGFFGTYHVTYAAENENGERDVGELEFRVVPTGIDLASVEAGIGGFVLNGRKGDELGVSIDGVADINGDGKDEILIGAPGVGASDRSSEEPPAGAAYLVQGADEFEPIELTPLSAQSSERRYFYFEGRPGDHAGVSVSGLGRVDNDTTGDLVIGANGGNGRAYVVFTRGLSTSLARGIKLPSSDGFTLFGDSTYSEVGRVVSAAGDPNGDGVPDVIVSFRNQGQTAKYGWLWVASGSPLVPGQEPRSSLVFNADGFYLQSRDAQDTFPLAAAGVGDLDDDGYDEVLVASHSSFLLVRGGTTYPDSEALEPDGSSGGWSQKRTGGRGPASVSRAGDVDADGQEDVVYCDGVLYCRVVFGPPTTLGTGWTFAGFAPGATQLLATGGGDIDGDGYSDLVFADDDFAYALYGKPTGHSEVNVASLRTAGYRITAPKTGTITTLAMLGDVNGDGVSDFAIGDASAEEGAGRVYVIFGVLSDLDAGDD